MKRTHSKSLVIFPLCLALLAACSQEPADDKAGMNQQAMPRIDFYKLSSDNSNSINRFCCQLTDKAVNLGLSVFVSTENEHQTRLLDDMMWTFSDSSFLPHARQDDDSERDAPVIIGHRAPRSAADLLINLSGQLPESLHNFERIAEIINNAPDNLHKGRLRYAAYKRDAYPLHYHEITS